MSTLLQMPAGLVPVPAGSALVVEVYNAVSGNVINLKYQMSDESGKLMNPSVEVIVPSSDRSVYRKTIQMIGGDLIWINLNIAANVNCYRGQCFVVVYLQHNTGSQLSNPISRVLIQSYLTAGASLVYPGSPIQTYFDPPGYEHYYTIGSPGAGADFSLTVPANALYIIKSASFDYVSNAAGTNRRIILQATNSTGMDVYGFFSLIMSSIGQSPSNTYRYFFGCDGNNDPMAAVSYPGVYFSGKMSKIVLYPTDKFSSAVLGKNAGDNFSSIKILLEEFILPVAGGSGSGGSGSGGPA